MDEPIFANDDIDEGIDDIEVDAIDQDSTDDEYEEIDSDEVDRVVSILEDLTDTIQSENIRHLLEQVSTSIYYLVYAEDEDEAVEDDLFDEAA